MTFIVYTLGGEEAACRPARAEEQEQHQDQGGSSKNHPHCQGSARQRVQELAPCSNMEARVRPRRGRIMQPFSSHRTKWPVAVEAWKGCGMRDASALRTCQYSMQMTQKKMPVLWPQASRSTKGGARPRGPRGGQTCLPPEPAWNRKLQQRRQENSSSLSLSLPPFCVLGACEERNEAMKNSDGVFVNLRCLG